MTNQEAFDKVKTHLLTQQQKSQNSNSNICLYRGPNGLKCAVGALIPDEEFKEELNNYSVVQYGMRTLPSLKGLDIELLATLQIVHDESEVAEWENELRKVAEKFNLKWE